MGQEPVARDQENTNLLGFERKDGIEGGAGGRDLLFDLGEQPFCWSVGFAEFLLNGAASGLALIELVGLIECQGAFVLLAHGHPIGLNAGG